MSRAQAERIFVWSICPIRLPPIADLVGKRADTHFGVTNELSGGMGNYALAQDWAMTFHEQRFGGLRYKSRFDSEAAPDAFALAAFNDQGGATGGWFVSSGAEAEPASNHIQALGITLVDPPIKPSNIVELYCGRGAPVLLRAVRVVSMYVDQDDGSFHNVKPDPSALSELVLPPAVDHAFVRDELEVPLHAMARGVVVERLGCEAFPRCNHRIALYGENIDPPFAGVRCAEYDLILVAA